MNSTPYYDEDTGEYAVDWLEMLFGLVPYVPVRTKGFEIDGSNDPKRGFKGWAPTTAVRHRRGFTGATAEDMPQ